MSVKAVRELLSLSSSAAPISHAVSLCNRRAVLSLLSLTVFPRESFASSSSESGGLNLSISNSTEIVRQKYNSYAGAHVKHTWFVQIRSVEL